MDFILITLYKYRHFELKYTCIFYACLSAVHIGRYSPVKYEVQNGRFDIL